jgi:hypothetical protein
MNGSSRDGGVSTGHIVPASGNVDRHSIWMR